MWRSDGKMETKPSDKYVLMDIAPISIRTDCR